MVSIVGARRSAQEPLCKSPKAEAAHGAKIDQLGGKVGPENGHSTLPAQPLPLRAGNARTCSVCGSALKPRRAGRRKKYCCYRCRDEARRARNFEVFATTRRVGASIPRSGGNNQSNPRACNGHFGDRLGILAPRAVIQVEVFGNRRWRRVTSPDGVTCDVSHLP